MSDTPSRTSPKSTDAPAHSVSNETAPTTLGNNVSVASDKRAVEKQHGPSLSPAPWIPDPMQLAHLAALIFPDNCRHYSADEAIQKAWALFAHSKVFCMKLQTMSAEELFLLYGTTPGINHTSTVVKRICASAPPKKTLRFYPDGNKADGVCVFLRAKQPRAIRERLRKYCFANKEEGDDSPYESLLHDTKRKGEDGKKYHEFTVDLLTKLLAYEKEVKANGGKRKFEPPSQVLTAAMQDEDDATVETHVWHKRAKTGETAAT